MAAEACEQADGRPAVVAPAAPGQAGPVPAATGEAGVQGVVAVQKANGRPLGVRRTRSLGSRKASLGHPTITRPFPMSPEPRRRSNGERLGPMGGSLWLTVSRTGSDPPGGGTRQLAAQGVEADGGEGEAGGDAGADAAGHGEGVRGEAVVVPGVVRLVGEPR